MVIKSNRKISLYSVYLLVIVLLGVVISAFPYKGEDGLQIRVI